MHYRQERGGGREREREGGGSSTGCTGHQSCEIVSVVSSIQRRINDTATNAHVWDHGCSRRIYITFTTGVLEQCVYVKTVLVGGKGWRGGVHGAKLAEIKDYRISVSNSQKDIMSSLCAIEF